MNTYVNTITANVLRFWRFKYESAEGEAVGAVRKRGGEDEENREERKQYGCDDDARALTTHGHAEAWAGSLT